MFYSGDERNEMTIDRDIMVLANPEIGELPARVVALVAAGGVAAALSTSAGLLLVISTSVSHDLLKRNLAPNITDKQELLYAVLQLRRQLSSQSTLVYTRPASWRRWSPLPSV